MESIEQVVEMVRRRFELGYPNGFLLGWNRARYQRELERATRPWSVTNCTDFNYSFCNTFHIDRCDNRRDLSPVQKTIVLRMSFIVDAYSLHVIRRTRAGSCGTVPTSKWCELMPIINRIRSFAEENGFWEIDDRRYAIVVEGVSLELARVPTLGKCLFDDYE